MPLASATKHEFGQNMCIMPVGFDIVSLMLPHSCWKFACGAQWLSLQQLYLQLKAANATMPRMTQ